MPRHHKKKRRKWHVLKGTIVLLLTFLEKNLEEDDKETVQEFIHFLHHMYD